MKFKEFSAWCNSRASDGCWGITEAIICSRICRIIYNKKFWKREKFWKEYYEKNIVSQIVEPINKKIRELENVK